MLLAVLALGSVALAEPPAAPPAALSPAASASAAVPADRAAVRFSAPEIGGPRAPRFITERQLAFEARLVSLAERATRTAGAVAYLERHVRGALERHVAETMLASLPVEPEPKPRELARQAAEARRGLVEQVGGEAPLAEALRAEGLAEQELNSLLRRRARASLYLDRMVAPMLAPTRTELRLVYANEKHPYQGSSFERVESPLRRWVIARRLADAVENYFQGARQRLEITILPRLEP